MTASSIVSAGAASTMSSTFLIIDDGRLWRLVDRVSSFAGEPNVVRATPCVLSGARAWHADCSSSARHNLPQHEEVTMVRRLLPGVFLTLIAVACISVIADAQTGRWKLDGNGGCYFDANDDGPDQCSATIGRWKLDGNGGCYFDAADSGPNQCAPQTPAESEIAAPEGAVGAGPEHAGGAEQDRDVAPQR